MFLKPLQGTERHPFDHNPRSIKNAYIDRIFDMGEKGLKWDLVILNRKDDAIDAEIQGCYDRVFRVRIVFFTDRDTYANKLISGISYQIFQSFYRSPKTPLGLSHVIVQGRIGSPQFNFEETAPRCNCLLEQADIGKGTAIR